jgi:hypothetical protein
MYCPSLTLSDMFSILERRIYLLPRHDSFNISLPNDGSDSTHKLRAYFSVNRNDDDIVLKIAHHDRPQAPLPQIAAAQEVSGSKRKAGDNNNSQPAPQRQLRSNAQPAARPPPNEFKAWYDSLIAKHPDLKDKMPCLHWLADTGPCANSAVCTARTTRVHAVNAAVTKHMREIKKWLKLDPGKRFG